MIQTRWLNTENKDAWEACLPAASSVFGGCGYARIQEKFRKHEARLCVIEREGASICYPTLFRPLPEDADIRGINGRWDALTPEYTGPLSQGEDEALASAFSDVRDKMFRKEGVVAEFAHVHPWSDDMDLLADGRELNREIIWMDTAQEPETLWRDHLEHACRKNINAATRSGVKVNEGSSEAHLHEFYRIYRATMERNNAKESYYFSVEYFQSFCKEMPANSRYLIAEHEGRVIGGILYLYDDEHVYSYLGGADPEFQNLRPTNLMHWETARWAHETGRKRFILGGGYKPNDGIFRFKATFSPLRQPFHVYKRIHMENDYQLLDRRCREKHNLGDDPISYFPSYRYAAIA